MKKISIITPCYNEEENVDEVYKQVKEVFNNLSDKYTYEHIFIDNKSEDDTVKKLRSIAEKDHNIKIIINTRNFGHIRSPYHGLLQSTGDASIMFVADLQDPPSMIPKFIEKWEQGYKIVVGVKSHAEESFVMFSIRKLYYILIGKLSEIKLIKNFTGFGLYDKAVVKNLRKIQDPYPYFRGLIADLGYEIAQIEYLQPKRKRGITKNNFYTLYDMAMLGITNHSKIPLRFATIVGFLVSIGSILIALVYFILKLIWWDTFSLGLAPLVIGLFFIGAVQLFFIGVLGEYIGSIHTQVLKRPLVIEQERVNFDDEDNT